MFEYEGVHRIVYDGAWFIPVCTTCGRFVKADDTVTFVGSDEQPADEPNATCSKCGLVKMIFEGYCGST